MRRAFLSLAAITSGALVIAGCTIQPTDGPTPSPTASPSDPASPKPAPLLSYPDEPSPLWTFSLDQAGIDAGPDAYLTDPAKIRPFGNGIGGSPTPIDAGDAWITAATGRDALPTLIGLSPETGESLWTYQPEAGRLINCALTDHALACVVGHQWGDLDHLRGSGGRTAIVLLDPRTGTQTGGFDLPLRAMTVAATGSDLLVLMPTDPIDEGGWTGDYRVSRYTTIGDERWSTQVTLPADIPGMGYYEYLRPSSTLLGVGIVGSVWVLDLDDGSVLLEGQGGGLTPTPDGGLFTHFADPNNLIVTVIAPDGSLVAELPVYARTRPLVSNDAAAVLMDSDGALVELDTTTGATRSTGLSRPRTDTGHPDRPDAASVIDGTLLVYDVDDGLRGYDLDEPAAPAWHLPLMRITDEVFTDDALLYAGAIGGANPPGEHSIVAVRIDDGSLLWAYPATLHGATTGFDGVLGRAGGHLVVVEGPTMTALAP